MTFWTSQRIQAGLDSGKIAVRPDGNCPVIHCNAITLTIGREIYISPSEDVDRAPGEAIVQLGHKQSFTIPPGQFAFLMTEETIKMPNNCMAFINLRSKIKFRGLVNVSGFHVDPGFHGQLTFSVFNAGPRPITLRQGDQAFHMWFADLSDNEEHPKDMSQPQAGIDSNMLNEIAGDVFSIKGLAAKMNNSEEKIIERIHSIERDHAILKWSLALIVGCLAGLLVKYLGNWQ